MKTNLLRSGAALLCCFCSAAVSQDADQRPGTVKWKLPLGGNVGFCSPAIGKDGTIYFSAKDGNLYALYGDSGGLAETPWPMHARDPRHTGRALGKRTRQN